MRHDSADESKLIDLRQLGAMIDARGSGQASVAANHRATALPVFGADQLNRAAPPVVAAPVSPPPASLSPSISPPRRGVDTTVLLAMIGVLTLVVLGLAVYVVVSTPTTVVVESAVAAAPMLPEADAPKVARQPDPETVAAPLVVVQPTNDEPAGDDTPRAEATTKSRRPRPPAHRNRRTHESIPLSEPRRAPKPNPNPPKARATDDLPAECVIDPKGCGLGSQAPSTPRKPRPPAPAEDLPEKLAPAAIRSAMAKVKGNAKACRARFGGASGEKVMVKLSISGATGRVTQAAPMKPHAGTPLGACVAAALKRASFARFGASVQGVQYGVRL